MQEEAHASRDGGSRAVYEHDLAFVLQAQEVGGGGTGESEAHAFGGEERVHPGAQGRNGLFAFRAEVGAEVQRQFFIAARPEEAFAEWFVAEHPVKVGQGEI